MIKRIKQKARALGFALTAALFSAAFVGMFAPAAGLTVSLLSLSLAGAAGCVCLSAFILGKRPAAFTLLFAAAIASVLYAAKVFQPVAIWNGLREQGLAGNADIIGILLVLLLQIFSYFLLRESYGAGVLGFITLVCAALAWLFGETLRMDVSFLLLLSLSGAFAAESRARPAAGKALVSVCLAASLVTCAVVPANGVTDTWLADRANDVLKFVITALNLDKDDLEQRRTYNIGTYGWRTLSDRFGGPAYPTDETVMTVECEDPLYLRGSIRYSYNGSAWVDESNTEKAGRIKRYMLSGIEGILYRSEFESAFDLNKISADGLSLKTATVTFPCDNEYWAIYSPNRTESVQTDSDFNLFYNNIGELFSSRQLRAGDSYTLTYYAEDGETLSYLALTADDLPDEDYNSVLAMYREVPSCVETGVYTLVNDIINGAGTPYEMAQALNSYLKNNGTYTLTPEYVPENEDFVSYFLLNGLRGYCVYYASALTLMARIAGLPSRYVEGYLACPDENGIAVLTGEDAHAWTEIYIKGLGWLTFDPTPAETDQSGEDSMGSETVPTPTPTPEPTPTPTPTPDTEGETDSEPTPTPTPSFPEESEPTATPQTEEPFEESGDTSNRARKIIWWILLLFVLLATLAAMAVRRLHRAKPEQAQRRYKTDKDKLMLWYKACLNALACEGIIYVRGDTPLSFAEKALHAGCATEEFVSLSRIAADVCYSGKAPSPQYKATAKAAYAEIMGRLNKKSLLKLTVKLVKSGQGSIDRIP